MPIEVIYVVRHGFRSNWLVDPSTGDYSSHLRSPTGIAADPALTSHGVDQAKELAAHLIKVEPPVDRVYSSPYYRCLQTIEPFVALWAKQDKAANPVILGEAGLSEWYGSAPFEHPTSAPPEKLKQLFPAFDSTYVPAVVPSRMGETIAQLHDRVAMTMDALIRHCDKSGVRAVLLCSHAATIIALGRVLTGNMPDTVETEDFRAFTCGLSVYRRRSNTQAAVDNPIGQEVTEPSRETLEHIKASSPQGAASHNDCSNDLPGPSLPRSVDWKDGRGIGGGWALFWG
ncbi:hypothetical protein VP1G_06814 [Cytospora mali]|uniref:Transcription factor tau 55 kDa subunit n=1 Tax=Cytospora mali TaxID=578113 RepID=A0A194V6N3_CYTMA|nr:hypothetical protein VP1G_06814 [Valsa mali var. pyri (nom. inval.)]